ncbi:SDR family NAD(P)-dependent oxidoreductase [Streptomyces sp. NPDC020681]|uniref:SDR family NAD(P)-dependent oxidoreductase n=1 Tax=Streptomyces sp. NPDC020681 TaxID=3365083 RepID=UPI003793DB3B
MTTAVLITGTSSGIGRATVERLARRPELTVYATARRAESIADLADTGARVLALDVTDPASMAAAVKTVEAEHGAVGALVNNAGYGEYGPVEEVPLDRIRRQMDTNVIGLAHLVQLVLPGMRRAGRGRIVNISSMGGKVTFPLGAFYHASKFAVEGFTDVLRTEVKPFGIGVSLIEPGVIRTGFGSTITSTLSENTAKNTAGDSGPYAALKKAQDSLVNSGGTMERMAGSPDDVALAVERALTATRPRPRYVVTAHARALIATRRLLGDRGWDALVTRMYR